MRKALNVLLALLLAAGIMPLQVIAEETGETAETFEGYYKEGEYIYEVHVYANGGKLDPDDAYYVSKDRKSATYEAVVTVYVSEDDESDREYTLEYVPDAEVATRSGYEFDGWYMDKECTKELEMRTSELYPEPLELYAKWKEVWKKGWRETGKGWRYSEEEGKDYTNGVYKIGSKYYGFDKKGYMVKGWKKFSGKWYWFASSGAAAVGWKKISGKWYCFSSSGVMLTGWQKISKKWYYFTSGGAMVTGWKKLSGKWYYFLSSGAMKTGWLKLNGKWYYFRSSGAMVTGTLKIGSKTYTFNSSGVCQNP